MRPLLDYPSQWTCLLHHLGEWRGTFTDIGPTGTWGRERPSVVTLTGLQANRVIRQTITVDGSSKVLEYGGLGRGVLFFADGAFSQGAMQRGPLGEFGAELALLYGERRVRCAFLFQDNHLRSFTLIRECRGEAYVWGQTLPLAAQQTWYGQTTTLYPDWHCPPMQRQTQLSLEISESGQVRRRLWEETEGEQWVTYTPAHETCYQPAAPWQGVLLWLADGIWVSVLQPAVPATTYQLTLELFWWHPEILLGIRRIYRQDGAWESLKHDCFRAK